jgi:hypothetical protein
MQFSVWCCCTWETTSISALDDRPLEIAWRFVFPDNPDCLQFIKYLQFFQPKKSILLHFRQNEQIQMLQIMNNDG